MNSWELYANGGGSTCGLVITSYARTLVLFMIIWLWPVARIHVLVLQNQLYLGFFLRYSIRRALVWRVGSVTLYHPFVICDKKRIVFIFGVRWHHIGCTASQWPCHKPSCSPTCPLQPLTSAVENASILTHFLRQRFFVILAAFLHLDGTKVQISRY